MLICNWATSGTVVPRRARNFILLSFSNYGSTDLHVRIERIPTRITKVSNVCNDLASSKLSFLQRFKRADLLIPRILNDSRLSSAYIYPAAFSKHVRVSVDLSERDPIILGY